MKRIQKLLFIFSLLFIAPLAFLFSACDVNKLTADNVQVRVSEDYVQWSYDGTNWENIVSVNDLKEQLGDAFKGDSGDRTEFRKTDTHIQWRYIGDSNWNNLIALEDMKGEKGEDADVWTISNDGYWYKNGVKTDNKAIGENGTTPTISISEDGYWVINDNKTTCKAIGLEGQDGNGIKSISKSEDSLKTNETQTTYIITFDDNSTFEFIIKNGTNGNDGKTPYIGDNGNWWIGEEDTLVKATINQYFNVTFNLLPATRLLNGVSENVQVKYGENIILPTPINDFGYEFEGWYSTTNGVITSNDGKVTNVTSITRDLTLMPVFKDYGPAHTTASGLSYKNYTVLKSIDVDIVELEIPNATTHILSNINGENITKITVAASSLNTATQGSGSSINLSSSYKFNSTNFPNIQQIYITGEQYDYTIPTCGFQSLYNLEKIVFDCNVVSVGIEAFINCENLEYINGQNICRINSNSDINLPSSDFIKDCSKIEEIVILAEDNITCPSSFAQWFYLSGISKISLFSNSEIGFEIRTNEIWRQNSIVTETINSETYVVTKVSSLEDLYYKTLTISESAYPDSGVLTSVDLLYNYTTLEALVCDNSNVAWGLSYSEAYDNISELNCSNLKTIYFKIGIEVNEGFYSGFAKQDNSDRDGYVMYLRTEI